MLKTKRLYYFTCTKYTLARTLYEFGQVSACNRPIASSAAG